MLSTPMLLGLKAALAGFDDQALAAARIDRIQALEDLKNAVSAAQARETAAFVIEQRAANDHVDQTARARAAADRAITRQVGLAKRSSPFHAQRYCGWALVLTNELPATFAQLQAGQITEWRAMIMARETAWLSRADRAVVDSTLAPHLQRWGDARVEAAVKTLAYQLDPTGYMARIRGAHADRRVSVRPAPDVMARLSALLPAAQGIAAHTALSREADRLRALGDTRSRAQIMADTLVQRLTGQSSADDFGVEIELIMTDEALFASNNPDTGDYPSATDTDDAHTADDTDTDTDTNDTDADTCTPDAHRPVARRPSADAPGYLIGYGPIPADLARDLALGRRAASDRAGENESSGARQARRQRVEKADPCAPRWIRRLYTSPDTGDLAAMDSRRRLFTPAQCRFIRLREHGICRTPWCDAPVRHTDHIRSHARGGRTTVNNGQGLCEACNQAKEARGWRSEPLGPGTAPDIAITTPTGHTYISPAPRPPNRPPRPVPRSISIIDADIVYCRRH